MPTLGFRSVHLAFVGAIATQFACGGGDGNGRDDANDASSGSDGSTSGVDDAGTTGDGSGTADGSPGSGDGSDSGSADSSGDDSTDSGLPVCDTETHACVGQPDGWNGPVAVAQAAADQEPPTCDSLAYPDLALERSTGLVAPQADCQCSCAASTDAQCETEATLRYYGQDAMCGGVPTDYLFFEDSCFPFGASTVLPTNSRFTMEPVPVVSGTCEPQSAAVIDPPAFEGLLVACEAGRLASDGCSNNRVCAPLAPQNSSLCVWQDGLQECPAEYPERRVAYTAIEDTRGCSECTCGGAQGLCDDARVVLYSTTGCTGSSGQVIANSECTTSSASLSTRRGVLELGEPTAFCDPSGGEPTGEAVGTEPVTICCLEAAE